MKSMGVGREKDCFGGIPMDMDEGISAMASEGRERRGRDERKREERRELEASSSPNGASYRAAQVHLPLHCIGKTARRTMRASAPIYGFAQEQSLAANLPSRQAIVTRPPKRLMMDDGGECKHAHL